MIERIVPHAWPMEPTTGFAAVWASIVSEVMALSGSRRSDSSRWFHPHLVTRGRGTFTTPEGTFRVGPGDLFCVWAGLEHEFHGAPDDPLHFFWMRLEGPGAEAALRRIGLSPTRRIGRPARPHQAVRLFRQLLEHYGAPHQRDPLIAASLLFRLLALLQPAAPPPTEPNSDRRLVEEAEAMLEYLLNTGINVSTLAERLGVTRQRLFQAFRAESGTTPAAFIQSLRIARAKQLLRSTDLKTAVIARACGYRYDKYFYRRFREVVGMTPSDWRVRR